jgi:hypothetical protein
MTMIFLVLVAKVPCLSSDSVRAGAGVWKFCKTNVEAMLGIAQDVGRPPVIRFMNR